MSKERAQRTQELFLAALELPEKERASWLKAEFGADDELVNEVLQLLRHDRRSQDPLEAGLARAVPDAPALWENQAKSGLHVRCPHCHHPIELVDAELSDVVCDSCGSSFSLISSEETKAP